MYPTRIKPIAKHMIWGGNRLVNEYGLETNEKKVAEAWMLSCNEAGLSLVLEGPLAQTTLCKAIGDELSSVLGHNNNKTDIFPVLIKLIDAHDDLSIQVHPDDAYAVKNGLVSGKTELWYILDASDDAFIYYGFSREVSKEELKSHIEKKTLPEILNRVPVNKGDVFFIESGVIHAIGAGILLMEVQQNANTTYRVYDYDRKDAAGNLRELHLDEALEVVDRSVVGREAIHPQIEEREGYSFSRLMNCQHFTVDRLDVKTGADCICGEDSFASVVITRGSGQILFENKQFGTAGSMAISKGDSIFIPAGAGPFRIQGQCEAFITRR
jgi:mannose-6-phosphate isomerase